MGEGQDIPLELDHVQRRRDEIRSVIRLSVPVVVTICSRLVMDLADFVMISHLGDQAQNAQGAILPAQVTMWTFIVLGFGTVAIVNSFVSQSLGRERYADASGYAWQAFYLGVAYGCVALLASPLLPGILRLIDHSPAIREMELAYTRVAVMTVGPTVAAEAFASFFNGVHRPKVSMWSAVEANSINVVVSMTLIFGLFGLPALGIAGAAWGTFIGTVYRLLRLMIVFVGPKYAAEFSTRRMWRFSAPRLRGIIRVGLPQGLQWFSDVFVWMVFITVLVGRFGDQHLIATNVSWQYMRISFVPTIGLGVALSALVGKAVGKGDPDQAERLARISVTMILAYMSVLSVVYLLLRSQLIALWNDDPEIVKIGARVMICAVMFLLFDGLGIAYNSALRGAGDTFWPAALFVISHWLVVVGGGSLMVFLLPEWGSLGPWSAATGLIIFIGLALRWRWNSGAWRKIDIFKHTEGESPATEAQ